MYILGIIIFCILNYLLMSFSSNGLIYFDFPSLLVIFGLSTPVIIASGLWKDLMKGFRLMQYKINPYSLVELKKILIAIQMSLKVILLAGFLGTLVGSIAFMSMVDSQHYGPSFSVALLTLFYALLFSAFLLPIEAKTKAVIATMD